MGTVRLVTSLVVLLVLLLAAPPRAQDAGPGTPLTLVTNEGRQEVPTTRVGGQDLVALEDVQRHFGVTVREDALAGGVTVSYQGRTIVASADRPMASVDGRIVTLPSPVVRDGGRWLVPVEFLSGALASIYDRRIDYRRESRLLLVGNVSIPRVSARVDRSGPPTRATIDITPSADVTVTREPGRLLLQIDAAEIDPVLPPDGSGLIDAIALGNRPNVVVVALSPATEGRATITTVNGRTTRVLIDVAPAATATVPSGSPRPAPVPPPPSSPPLAGIASPGPALSAAAAGLGAGPSRAWQTIAIDAGHGGYDRGVQGSGGLEEGQVTLDIARRLKSLVETRLGLRVLLTRDSDLSLTPDERAAVANNGRASMLLSLHLNGSTARGQAGAEIYYLRLEQETEQVARTSLAGAVTLPTFAGGLRTIDLIPWELAQSRHLDESAIFAGVLQEELERHVPMSRRPLRRAPMRLLSSVNMPAALVEMAYLTNPGQEAQLESETFKDTMALALFDAVVRFRAWSEQPRTP
jgi:N-acetylmuramoyl-L-alanine amidase